jgi:hypothetical protein
MERKYIEFFKNIKKNIKENINMICIWVIVFCAINYDKLLYYKLHKDDDSFIACIMCIGLFVQYMIFGYLKQKEMKKEGEKIVIYLCNFIILTILSFRVLPIIISKKAISIFISKFITCILNIYDAFGYLITYMKEIS